MKKCPYCAEEIQEEAVKCKHCFEFLDESKRPAIPGPPALPKALPWYFRTWWIVVVALSIPPFAFPMVWWHTTMSIRWKIINTIGILLLTWLLWLSLVKSWEIFQIALETAKGMQDG